MYLHKENRELFRDAILLASQKLEVSEVIVEKDYYVTMILKKLSAIEYPVVFKGGASLSKAFHVIDRFSEDIDITFTEHLGEARGKKLKYNILQPIADELGLVIRNFDFVESDKNLNHYDYYMQGKAHRNARHFYDIYKLSEHIIIDDDFLKLVEKVRNHRIGMGTEIAPAAPWDVDIFELVKKI